MRYGIDLDGVCFDFLNTFRERLNNTFNLKLENEEITSYYWHENTDGFDKDDFFNELDKFGREGGYRNLPVFPGTLDALEKIQNAGHHIFYITNRPEYARQDTLAALKEHGFPFDRNLLFACGDKATLINDLSIDIFVEDSGETIMDIVNKTKAQVYCVDYPHNRDIEHHRVERIKDWDDFLLAEVL